MKNIWAIGRNYTDHIKELGNTATKPDEGPMVFLKSTSCLVPNGQQVELVKGLGRIDFETEIVLRFGKALSFDAYAIGLDITARDQQAKLKGLGHPWTLAKSFKNSCLIGDWLPLKTGDLSGGFEFQLTGEGEKLQHGHTRNMIYGFDQMREYLVQFFPVEPGDVLFTGTPSGIGPILAGQKLKLEILSPVKYQIEYSFS